MKKLFWVVYINYSNFDKYHFKDFHKAQYTEPTTSALDNLWQFLQIQRYFQWQLKMQWASAFYANHSLDGPMDTRWSEKAKCYIFEIPPKKSGLFLRLVICLRKL